MTASCLRYRKTEPAKTGSRARYRSLPVTTLEVGLHRFRVLDAPWLSSKFGIHFRPLHGRACSAGKGRVVVISLGDRQDPVSRAPKVVSDCQLNFSHSTTVGFALFSYFLVRSCRKISTFRIRF